jgi:hypothetical protein
MTLHQTEQLFTTLSSLAKTSMPIRLAYKITKLLNQIEKDYNFYIEETKKIIIKYAERDEQGQLISTENGSITLQKNLISEAEKDLLELSEIEVDLPSISFTLDELETLNITPSDLQSLLPFIEE